MLHATFGKTPKCMWRHSDADPFPFVIRPLAPTLTESSLPLVSGVLQLCTSKWYKSSSHVSFVNSNPSPKNMKTFTTRSEAAEHQWYHISWKVTRSGSDPVPQYGTFCLHSLFAHFLSLSPVSPVRSYSAPVLWTMANTMTPITMAATTTATAMITTFILLCSHLFFCFTWLVVFSKPLLCRKQKSDVQ